MDRTYNWYTILLRLVPQFQTLLEDPEIDNADLDKFTTSVCIVFSPAPALIFWQPKIQKGANDARADDLRRIKEELGGWLNIDFSPTTPFAIKSCADRGLQNDITGRLLCPIEHKWDDDQQVASSFQVHNANTHHFLEFAQIYVQDCSKSLTTTSLPVSILRAREIQMMSRKITFEVDSSSRCSHKILLLLSN